MVRRAAGYSLFIQELVNLPSRAVCQYQIPNTNKSNQIAQYSSIRKAMN